MVIFELAPGAPDAAALVALAKERSVLVMALGPLKVRAITHLDVTTAQCEQAAGVLKEVAEGRR